MELIRSTHLEFSTQCFLLPLHHHQQQQYYVYWVGKCVCAKVTVCVWRVEDDLVELVLFLYIYMSFRTEIRTLDKCLTN